MENSDIQTRRQRARAVLVLGGGVLGPVAAGRQYWRRSPDSIEVATTLSNRRTACSGGSGSTSKTSMAGRQCALRGARRRNVFVNNRSSGTC